jgi:hypothetical protein
LENLVSRPRKPSPPDPGLIELPGRVVCTDRGQHAEARITSFADEQEPGGGRKLAFAETPLWDVIADSGPDWGPTFRFRCRRCGRAPQLREETVLAVIDAFRQGGGGRKQIAIDISLLPC